MPRLREEWWITGRADDDFSGYDRYKTDSGREGVPESRKAIIGSNSERKGGTDDAKDDTGGDTADRGNR